jgi:hypothetical protein
MAELKTASKNDLPDSAFAIILPGGTKDATGRTQPRSLRKFPIHDAPPHSQRVGSPLPGRPVVGATAHRAQSNSGSCDQGRHRGSRRVLVGLGDVA